MDGYCKNRVPHLASLHSVCLCVCVRVQVESRDDPEFSLDLRLKFWKFIKEDLRYVHGTNENITPVIVKVWVEYVCRSSSQRIGDKTAVSTSTSVSNSCYYGYNRKWWKDKNLEATNWWQYNSCSNSLHIIVVFKYSHYFWLLNKAVTDLL